MTIFEEPDVMTPLAQQHCQPLEGHAPMSAAQVTQHLALVPGWAYQNGAIEKPFSFTNYSQTLAFVNAVASIAHREDHHPHIAFGYNRCTLRFDTHSVGGISMNDFICAAQVEALPQATAF
jgi:4a-hydroxytetrahydrobiopterin dehydratase